MAAPVGNQFWKARATHGRDKIFSTAECLWDSCQEYFQWCEDNPLLEQKVFHAQGELTYATVEKMRAMTMQGLCGFLDIGVSTWHDYRNRNDFSEVITRAEEVIYNQKFSGAAADLLNANIIARDLGLNDSQKIDHTTNGKNISASGDAVLAALARKHADA